MKKYSETEKNSYYWFTQAEFLATNLHERRETEDDAQGHCLEPGKQQNEPMKTNMWN